MPVPARRILTSSPLIAGIKSWLTFSLTLYSALQPNADGTVGSATSAADASNNTLRYNQIQVSIGCSYVCSCPPQQSTMQR